KVTTVGLRRPRSKIADILPGKLGEPLLSETLRLAPPTSLRMSTRARPVENLGRRVPEASSRTHFSPMRASCNLHFEQWRTSFQRVPTAIMSRIINDHACSGRPWAPNGQQRRT